MAQRHSIWQELVDRHGFAGSYHSVKRFIPKLHPSSVVAHPRITTAPDEEGQVDYGTGPWVKHPEPGRYRRTRLFAMTLSCSRKSVWLLAWADRRPPIWLRNPTMFANLSKQNGLWHRRC